jgi:hypothetical protein
MKNRRVETQNLTLELQFLKSYVGDERKCCEDEAKRRDEETKRRDECAKLQFIAVHWNRQFSTT